MDSEAQEMTRLDEMDEKELDEYLAKVAKEKARLQKLRAVRKAEAEIEELRPKGLFRYLVDKVLGSK